MGSGLQKSGSLFSGTKTQKQALNEILQTDDKLNSLISVDEISVNALSRTEAPHLPLYGGSDDNPLSVIW